MSQSQQQQSTSNVDISTETVSEVSTNLQDQMGNAAIQEQLLGPSGRVFTKIVEGSGGTATTDSTFTKPELKDYLDHELAFANGEFFRGTKLNGAADAMFEELNTSGDGFVDWGEFSAINSQLIKLLVPLVGEADYTPEQITKIANEQFDSLVGSQDGFLDLNELQTDALDRLPAETEHKGLVSQLAAKLAIDAIDRGQAGEKMDNRQISREEWVQTAVELLTK